MKIDGNSPWRAEWEVSPTEKRVYDAPKCALTQWVRAGSTQGGPRGTLRFQEYYDRVWTRAEELTFVKGSDVVGPMGADLVPVAPIYAGKFMKDHAGGEALPLQSIGEAQLSGL
jgi:hypothetical protein